jgi:tryptophan-rich sensory protein
MDSSTILGAQLKPQQLTELHQATTTWYALPRPIGVLDVATLILYGLLLIGCGRVTSWLSSGTNPPEKHEMMPLIKHPKWSPKQSKIRQYFRTLYICQAPAIWIILLDDSIGLSSLQVQLFILQFFLYLMWPILFFRYKRPDLAALDAVLLWFLIDVTIYSFWQVNVLASICLYPYLSWITTAVVLSITLWRLNKNKKFDDLKSIPTMPHTHDSFTQDGEKHKSFGTHKYHECTSD